MFDVFVSYSSKDNAVADAMVHVLEERGVRCWIAPRNILPGSDYADAIDGALKEVKVVAFIHSQDSLESVWCKSEINVAVSNEKIIVPFKIDKAIATGGWNLYLAKSHWIDAVPEPQKKFGEVARSILSLLGRESKTSELRERSSESAETVFKERVRKFKCNDGVLDDEELRRLVALAGRLGIGAAQREQWIAEVEDECEAEGIGGGDTGRTGMAASSSTLLHSELERVEVSERIMSVLKRLGPCDEFMLKGEIPAKKMAGARSILAGWTSTEEILAVLDTTLFGSATDGLVITPAAVYFKNNLEGAKRAPWSEVFGVTAHGDDIMISGLKFSGCPVNKKWLAGLADAIREIANWQSSGTDMDGDSVGRIIAKECSRISDCGDIYCRGGLREDKLRAAMASMSVREPSGAVVLQVDTTVFGGAKEGMVLTEAAVYFKNIVEDPVRLEWSEIKKVGTAGTDIVFNGGLTFQTPGSWKDVDARVFSDMLGQLARRLGR